jgi:hypothetical protein
MFLTVKRLIALSLATAREQLEQRMNLTWPRPFLLRPPFLLFLVYTGTVDDREQGHPSFEYAIQLVRARTRVSTQRYSTDMLVGMTN